MKFKAPFSLIPIYKINGRCKAFICAAGGHGLPEATHGRGRSRRPHLRGTVLSIARISGSDLDFIYKRVQEDAMTVKPWR